MHRPKLTALAALAVAAAAPGAVSVGGQPAVIHHAHAKTEDHRAHPWPAAGKYRGAASQASQAKLRRGQRRRGARRLRLARQGGRR